MPLCPEARRVSMARLRRVAMFSGPCPVRILEASSAKAVAYEVESVLDGPVGACEAGELLWGNLEGGQVGDRVDGLPGDLAGRGVGAVPQDLRGLDDVREVQVQVGDGQHPQRAGLSAPVPGLAVVAGADAVPGQLVATAGESADQRGWSGAPSC
jgi:hypothetical protein